MRELASGVRAPGKRQCIRQPQHAVACLERRLEHIRIPEIAATRGAVAGKRERQVAAAPRASDSFHTTLAERSGIGTVLPHRRSEPAANVDLGACELERVRDRAVPAGYLGRVLEIRSGEPDGVDRDLELRAADDADAGRAAERRRRFGRDVANGVGCCRRTSVSARGIVTQLACGVAANSSRLVAPGP